MDSRLLLAVDIQIIDLELGLVLFAGDKGTGTADRLVVSETVDDGVRYLSHDLRGKGGTGDYFDSRDLDPGIGVIYLALDSDYPPLIAIYLGSGDDTLQLDNSWSNNHEVILNAGGGTDTLIGPGATSTWHIGAGNSGDLIGPAALIFSGVESLVGGSGTDTLIGQDLTAAWNLGPTPSYTSATTALTFSGFETLQGGSSTDTLIGQDLTASWDLGLTPSYTSAITALTFSGFETLQGGSFTDTFAIRGDVTATLKGGAGPDSFAFHDAAKLAGSIDGEADGGILDYSSYGTVSTPTAISVALTGLGLGTETTSITGTFSGIDWLVGSDSAGDTLTGDDVGRTWTIDTDDGGNVDGFSFWSVENLKGGADDDRFNVSGVASIRGTIDGGGHRSGDVLDYTGYGNGAIAVDLQMRSATAVNGGAAGGISGLEALVGSSIAGDRLTGANLTNTWTIGTFDGGSVNTIFTFSSIENLAGGSGADEFHFGDTSGVSGRINGGDGVDTLNYSASTTAIQVNLATLTATGTLGFACIENLIGSHSATANDTLIGANRTNSWSITADNSGDVNGFTFSSLENLIGGGVSDTFAFGDGVGLRGTLSGGSGMDALILNYGSGRGILATITANDAGNIAGAGVASFTFASIESLTGGAGDDTFAFLSGRTLSGALNGRGGTNALNFSANTTGVRVNLTTGVVTGIGGGVSGIRNVLGGAGNDILIGNEQDNRLAGNGGNDILVGLEGNDLLFGDNPDGSAAASGRDILIGGNGSDLFSGGARDDLLVAGSTTYDLNLSALICLMSEWSRADAEYSTRIAHINGTLAGGRNGTVLLIASGPSRTVFGDDEADTLNGGTDLDWFLADSGDFTDRDGATETQTTLTP